MYTQVSKTSGLIIMHYNNVENMSVLYVEVMFWFAFEPLKK